MGKDDRQAELDNEVQHFAEAWATGNKATLESLLSPTYSHSDALGGFHDRTSWLEPFCFKRAGIPRFGGSWHTLRDRFAG